MDPKKHMLVVLIIAYIWSWPTWNYPSKLRPISTACSEIRGVTQHSLFCPPCLHLLFMLILCNYKFNLPAFFIIELKIKPNDSSLLVCIAFVAPTWINLTIITTTLLIDDVLYLCDSDLSILLSQNGIINIRKFIFQTKTKIFLRFQPFDINGRFRGNGYT
jgi:hypothetical protein